MQGGELSVIYSLFNTPINGAYVGLENYLRVLNKQLIASCGCGQDYLM